MKRFIQKMLEKFVHTVFYGHVQGCRQCEAKVALEAATKRMNEMAAKIGSMQPGDIVGLAGYQSEKEKA